MNLRYLVFFFILNFFSGFGQSFLSTNGKAIVNSNGDTVILKAMNLGGWMLIEPYQIQAADGLSEHIRTHPNTSEPSECI